MEIITLTTGIIVLGGGSAAYLAKKLYSEYKKRTSHEPLMLDIDDTQSDATELDMNDILIG